MSSSKSRRRLEGTVKVKSDRSAKDSPINGTDNSEEDNSQDDSDSESRVKKDVKSKRSAGSSQPMNYSIYSLSDDVKKLIERVTCCSCGKQINVMNYGAVRRHPWLKVVTCKKCFKFLKSGPFTLDNEGIDEQCRWCGDGGRLYGCDYCHNCFCRSCIKRNLGRSEATKMEAEDGSKWHCYMCKPKKIKKLVEDCDKILDYVAREEKRDKEAEERRKKREMEKAARKAKEDSKERDSKVKVEDIKKEDVDSKKDDKVTLKKGFPAPKDKSEIKKEIKSETKPVSGGAKGAEPELIVLDDSPMKISEHHRSRGYKPDPKTGVLQVQKANNGVLEVMMGPKMNQPVVNTLPGRIEKSVVIPIIQKSTISSGGSKLKNTPPNDLNAFRCSILPMDIDATLEKITTRSQALHLELSSAKTDLAIARLSHVNMYQARQRACNQVRTSLEKFVNNLREIWGVQFIAKIGQSGTVENGDVPPSLFKMLNSSSTVGASNATSTPVKINETSSGLKLNESIIPIEIDSPSTDKYEDKTSSSEEKGIAKDKTEKSGKEKLKEGSVDKETVDKNTDDQEPMEVNLVESDGSEDENEKDPKKKEKDDGDSKKKGKDDTEPKKKDKDEGSKEKEVEESKKKEKEDGSKKKGKKGDDVEDKNKDPESSEEVEMEVDNGDNDEPEDEESEKVSSPKKKSQKDNKKTSDSDDAEETEPKDKSLDSENTAAELELLKQIADELNEKELQDKEDNDEEEAVPRRSTRAKKTAEANVKDDSEDDSSVRRSRRQKPSQEKSEEKADGKSSKSRSESRSSRPSRKTEKPVSDDDSIVSDSGNVKEGKEKGSKNAEKSKKSANVADDSDEDTIDEDVDSNDKSKSKSDNKDKHDKDKKSKDSNANDSGSKSNDKSKDKSSKVAKSDKLSKRRPSADSESTEVEDKKEDEKKVKSPSKSKGKEKKSPSKKGVEEDGDNESGDTDSSDMSFEEFGKKKKKRPKKEKSDEGDGESKRSSRRATRQSNKKTTENNPSDSDTDFDADLEKEITSLSKETKLAKKKQSSDKGGKKESSKVKDNKKDDDKDKKDSDKKRPGRSKDQSRQAKLASTEEEPSDPDSDFDADLEKEINTLSKETRLTRRKINYNEKESGKKDSSKAKEEKKGDDKKGDDKKGDEKKKPSKKQESVDESDSSSNDDMIPDDVDDSEDDTDNLSASQLKKLKQAGKAALEESDEGDDVIPEEISSDSDPEVSFPKLGSSKKGKKHDLSEASDDSDFVSTKKTKRLRNKLLDVKISDSESDSKKKGKKGKRGAKRKSKADSDEFSELSDEEENRKRGKGRKRRRIKRMASSDEEKVKEPGEDDEIADEDDDEEQTPGGIHKRKHIRKVIGSKKLKDETKAAQKAEEERRKRIEEKQKEYNMYVEVEENDEEEEQLPEGTERELSTPEKTDSLAKILGSPRKVPITTKCVLEMDKEKKKALIEVDRTLIRKLKPHQVEAVRFMYNCCVETIEESKKKEGSGSGCILAHCMGLGKTLSVITFVHTMLSNQKLTKMSKCLVVCPLNTVLNWVNEFEIWLEDVDFEIEVYEMSRVKQNFERAQMLKEWHEGGAGVMILGYDMYRNLVAGSHCKNKKQKKIFYETLADPGPDITVCDEGHILKNDATSLSKAMSKIKSSKRVVLTGTPLQNNLGEYHCMVNFVKPNLLGTRKEFNNRFNNPITNGQCKDSTAFDVKLMKRRAHILHELLAGCVQRKDYSALTKFLPPKFEYVISVRLSTVQMNLYEKYLEIVGSGEMFNKGARLFRDYQALMRIWTHPWVLRLDEIRQENKRQFDDSDEDSFVDDGSESDSFVESSSSSSTESDDEGSGGNKKKNKRKTRGRGGKDSSSDESKKGNQDEVVKKWTSKRRGNEEGAGSSWMEDMGYGNPDQKELSSEWWAEYVKEHDESKLELSGKLVLLFEILKMCEEIGDKVLVFSQSLLSLDIIEDFLQMVEDAQDSNTDKDDKTDSKSDPKPSTSSTSTSSSSTTDPSEEKKEKTEAEKNKENLSRYGRNWTKGADYFRMDGSTNSQNRKAAQDMFNDPENFRARLFLISTKAGSLGINLVSANRVIIFDASWNPSHDIQSIFRVYRFGQVKPVYVYRFLAQGTMEEKIYERQVTKQSLSQRVVDEHQIARHFSANDLQELYKFSPDRLDDPEKKDRPLPMLPKDHMLAELMTNNKDWVVTYHEHDSLLENVVEQELTEDEKKAAWEDYENEKKGLNRVQQMMGGANVNPAFYASQQMSMQNLLLQGQANLGQAAVLQIVQDLKVRFPNLPPEVFQQRVQAVLRQVLAQQIMQQSALQRQHVEQQRLSELNRLNQMKQQIQRQQAMISNPQNLYYSGGNSRMPQVQSLLSGNMSGLRPQTLNQLNALSNAPIDLTGQSSSDK